MQNRFALAVVLTAGILSSTAAFAQSSEEQQACMDDAFRVCSATIPDRARTTACMIQKKSQLSPRCQMVMDKYAQPSTQVAAAPTTVSAPVRMSTQARPVSNGRPGKPLNILMR